MEYILNPNWKELFIDGNKYCGTNHITEWLTYYPINHTIVLVDDNNVDVLVHPKMSYISFPPDLLIRLK